MPMRALIDIPKQQLDALTEIGRQKGVSRAEVIRTALDQYLKNSQPGGFEEFKGIWGAGEDGVAFQRRMREEW